jgi:DNA primase
MIQGYKKIKLTTDNILLKISDHDIFRYYNPIKNWKVNVIMLSPFRNEKNPSFIIGYKNNKLNFIDFSDTSLKGNCFSFVMLLYNISLKEALKLIDKDFGLGISNEPTKDYQKIISNYKQPTYSEEKKYSVIQVVTRKFNKEELNYWNQYHQDITDLKANNVFAIKKLYLNKQLFSIKENVLRFGYYYDGHWKIYKPFENKKSKWVPNNVPITTMDGLEDIKNCDVALINKSKKDYMVMKKLFPCSCAVQNEGMACFSEENLKYLKDNSNKQILAFDSDETGKKNSLQITKQFDFDYCNVPNKYLSEGIKDFADLAKVHGMQTIEDYLKQKKLI